MQTKVLGSCCSKCRSTIGIIERTAHDAAVEAEFFGYKKTFTGAARMHRGYLERADGGTLFLDEVGELPARMQAKLLRAPQERSFFRLGSEKVTRSDFRIIAATNRDLHADMAAGTFREDLFYRLAVIRIGLPPLRERPEDIRWLTERMLQRIAIEQGRPAARVGSVHARRDGPDLERQRPRAEILPGKSGGAQRSGHPGRARCPGYAARHCACRWHVGRVRATARDGRGGRTSAHPQRAGAHRGQRHQDLGGARHQQQDPAGEDEGRERARLRGASRLADLSANVATAPARSSTNAPTFLFGCSPAAGRPVPTLAAAAAPLDACPVRLTVRTAHMLAPALGRDVRPRLVDALQDVAIGRRMR